MISRYLVKLVRDRVGVLLPRPGVEYAPINSELLFINELRKKLAEEAAEYLIDPNLSELADVYEVVRALAARDLGLRIGDVIREARRKRDERGGFVAGVGMYANSGHVDE